MANITKDSGSESDFTVHHDPQESFWLTVNGLSLWFIPTHDEGGLSIYAFEKGDEAEEAIDEMYVHLKNIENG